MAEEVGGALAGAPGTVRRAWWTLGELAEIAPRALVSIVAEMEPGVRAGALRIRSRGNGTYLCDVVFPTLPEAVSAGYVPYRTYLAGTTVTHDHDA